MDSMEIRRQHGQSTVEGTFTGTGTVTEGGYIKTNMIAAPGAGKRTVVDAQEVSSTVATTWHLDDPTPTKRRPLLRVAADANVASTTQIIFATNLAVRFCVTSPFGPGTVEYVVKYHTEDA